MKLHLIAAAALAVGTLPAHAALTLVSTDIAAPATVIDFESYDGLLTSGPEWLAPDLVFTGDAGSELGANNRDLGGNGAWGAAGYFAAGAFVGELRFTFEGVSAGAGAFVNHFALNPLPFALVISAYGENSQIIETHTVTVNTSFDSYNEGLFVGIVRDSADIKSVSFKGVGVVLDNFTYTAPVPEPETYALMLGGLGLVGWMARRRRAAR